MQHPWTHQSDDTPFYPPHPPHLHSRFSPSTRHTSHYSSGFQGLNLGMGISHLGGMVNINVNMKNAVTAPLINSVAEFREVMGLFKERLGGAWGRVRGAGTARGVEGDAGGDRSSSAFEIAIPAGAGAGHGHGHARRPIPSFTSRPVEVEIPPSPLGAAPAGRSSSRAEDGIGRPPTRREKSRKSSTGNGGGAERRERCHDGEQGSRRTSSEAKTRTAPVGEKRNANKEAPRSRHVSGAVTEGTSKASELERTRGTAESRSGGGKRSKRERESPANDTEISTSNTVTQGVSVKGSGEEVVKRKSGGAGSTGSSLKHFWRNIKSALSSHDHSHSHSHPHTADENPSVSSRKDPFLNTLPDNYSRARHNLSRSNTTPSNSHPPASRPHYNHDHSSSSRHPTPINHHQNSNSNNNRLIKKAHQRPSTAPNPTSAAVITPPPPPVPAKPSEGRAHRTSSATGKKAQGEHGHRKKSSSNDNNGAPSRSLSKSQTASAPLLNTHTKSSHLPITTSNPTNTLPSKTTTTATTTTLKKRLSSSSRHPTQHHPQPPGHTSTQAPTNSRESRKRTLPAGTNSASISGSISNPIPINDATNMMHDHSRSYTDSWGRRGPQAYLPTPPPKNGNGPGGAASITTVRTTVSPFDSLRDCGSGKGGVIGLGIGIGTPPPVPVAGIPVGGRKIGIGGTATGSNRNSGTGSTIRRPVSAAEVMDRDNNRASKGSTHSYREMRNSRAFEIGRDFDFGRGLSFQDFREEEDDDSPEHATSTSAVSPLTKIRNSALSTQPTISEGQLTPRPSPPNRPPPPPPKSPKQKPADQQPPAQTAALQPRRTRPSLSRRPISSPNSRYSIISVEAYQALNEEEKEDYLLLERFIEGEIEAAALATGDGKGVEPGIGVGIPGRPSYEEFVGGVEVDSECGSESESEEQDSEEDSEDESGHNINPGHNRERDSIPEEEEDSIEVMDVGFDAEEVLFVRGSFRARAVDVEASPRIGMSMGTGRADTPAPVVGNIKTLRTLRSRR